MVGVDFVFHLAGVNRPKDEQEFVDGNVDLTKSIIDLLIASDAKSTFGFIVVYTGWS